MQWQDYCMPSIDRLWSDHQLVLKEFHWQIVTSSLLTEQSPLLASTTENYLIQSSWFSDLVFQVRQRGEEIEDSATQQSYYDLSQQIFCLQSINQVITYWIRMSFNSIMLLDIFNLNQNSEIIIGLWWHVNFGILYEFPGMSLRERKNKRREKKHNKNENGERKLSFILHHSQYI